jgi:hypothetical protein
MVSEEKCPEWCVCETHDDDLDHRSETVTRNSFRFELLRYHRDNITYVTFMTAMDGGRVITMPVETVVDLMGEVRQKVAA